MAVTRQQNTKQEVISEFRKGEILAAARYRIRHQRLQ